MCNRQSRGQALQELGHGLHTCGQLGHTMDAAALTSLGALLMKAGLEMHRMQRTLDEIVRDAAEQERATALRERFGPVVSAIVAGVATFQESNHITQQGDEH